MTGDVALDFLGALSVRQYIDRRIRWIRVRKRMSPILATLAEPFTESIMCGLYGAWTIDRLFGASRTAIFLVHMALWLSVDLGVRNSLATNVKAIGPPSGTASFIIAWLARELMTLPIWLYGIMSSNVIWRGKKYRILASGEYVEHTEAHLIRHRRSSTDGRLVRIVAFMRIDALLSRSKRLFAHYFIQN